VGAEPVCQFGRAPSPVEGLDDPQGVKPLEEDRPILDRKRWRNPPSRKAGPGYRLRRCLLWYSPRRKGTGAPMIQLFNDPRTKVRGL
jgi:hypothetical protein